MAKKARDLNTVARLKEVGKWHFRGMSNRKIAELMEMDEKQVRRDVAQISSRIREFDDLDSYLKDLIARTGEELTKLSNHEAELYELLDYAKEEVVKMDGFGQPIMKRNLETGAILKIDGREVPETGPRNPAAIVTTISQLAAIAKQRAELLKLVGPKVDISVNLQLQLQMQSRLMEVIRELDPAKYTQVYRELQVLAANAKQKMALPAGQPDAIEAEFTENAE